MVVKVKIAFIAAFATFMVAATGFATHTYASAWVANKIFAIG